MRYRIVAPVGLLLALIAPAAPAGVIVPPALENVQGGLGGTAPFSFPTNLGIHTQLAYDRTLFAAVSGPQLITAIQFRPIDPAGGIFGNSLVIDDVRLQLSTTQRSDEGPNVLSSTFSQNVGPDATTVYSGPLTLTTNSVLLPNGTRAFDYVIQLQTGFVYDPAAGNLLLDTVVPAGASIRGNGFFGAFPRFDTTGAADDGIFAVINSTSGSATTGTLSSAGPVTRFETTAVPEPSALLLAGAGTAFLLARRFRGTRRA